MNIGDKIYKNDVEQMKKYSEYVIWCSSNKAFIDDKGEYYEVVAMPPKPQLSEEQKTQIEALKAKSSLIDSAIDFLMQSALKDSEFAQKLKAITDNVALYIPEVFPKWSGNGVQYEKGDRVVYEDVLYKVNQNHTSQSDWLPTTAHSLYVKVISSIAGEIPDWQQPSAENAYMKGDKVRFNGKVYESTIDNNVWSPESYPDGWKLVKE